MKEHGYQVIVSFLYKYDRLKAKNGSLAKLFDPNGKTEIINKFLMEFTEASTQPYESDLKSDHSSNVEFVGLPDSPKSKKGIEERPVIRRDIKFYKGPCKSKNLFSCCD